MGDFAAGKMGTYSGPTGTASVEDVAQAIVDLEGLYESKVPALSCGAMLRPATLAASVIPFTPRLSVTAIGKTVVRPDRRNCTCYR